MFKETNQSFTRRFKNIMKTFIILTSLVLLGAIASAQAPDVESAHVCRQQELIYDEYSEAAFLGGGNIVFGGRGIYFAQALAVPLIETVTGEGTTIDRGYLDSPYSRSITDIIPTSDGGYAFAADLKESVDSDFLIEITKADADGNVEWSRHYTGDTSCLVKGLTQTAAGDFIAVGRQEDGIRSVSFILGIAGNGDSLWMDTYKIEGSYVSGYQVSETVSGGFLVAGLVDYSRLIVLKYNTSGDFLWAKRFNDFQAASYNLDMVRMLDGDFCIGANTALSGMITPILLMKIQEDGDTLWTRAINQDQGLWFGGMTVAHDNTVLVTASVTQEIGIRTYLAKIDGNGDMVWSGYYGYIYGKPSPLAVHEKADGTILIAGNTVIEQLGVETYLLKFYAGATGVDFDQTEVLSDGFALAQSYPNPFNSGTTIAYSLPRASSVKIEVFNILGQSVKVVVDEEKPSGEFSVRWDGTDATGTEVATGVYFYRLTIGDYTESRKMVLLK